MKQSRLWFGLRTGLVVLCAMLLVGWTTASVADEIKIGVVGPMKFANGEHTWRGAQIAADEINAAGGINAKGKKYNVEIIKADDNSFASMPDAVSTMERLVTLKKVNFVVGGCRTEAVLAQQEIMADNKVIFMGTGAAEGCLKISKNYNRYKYFFRVAPNQGSLGPNTGCTVYVAMLEPVIRAFKNIGVAKPKVALLVEKGKWADFIMDYSKAALPKMGCEVVGEWRPGFTATSMNSELSAIKNSGAHIIFQIFAGPGGNIISKQWGELKIPAALVGLNVEGGKESHWKATEGLCNYSGSSEMIVEGVVKTKKTKAFVSAFEKKYREAPMYNAPAAYDAVYILKEAIEKAGTLQADALVPVLEKADFTGPDGRIVFTPPNHPVPHGCLWGPQYQTWVGFQWIDGKRKAFWPDGHEINPALIAAGSHPKGWDKVRFEGTADYVLPPWVAGYWKGKK